MPIYEYRCRQCKKKMSRLVLNPRSTDSITCCHCGSPELDRLFSRFASPKSEESRLEALADPGNLSGVDENDPRSMAKFMKKMGQELGEDLGDDLDAAMEGEASGASDLDGIDAD
ncbi:MAG: zinc ribbon domain-containing protein [Nitrospiraceae bacterium]|nr:zinc ribbon domain-containing protein [Nitrospiraceae bacterium]